MMKNVLISGGSGLIGSALIKRLLDKGAYRITVLSRDPDKHRKRFPDQVQWLSDMESIGPDSHFDIVVNLAGAGIGDKRWSEKQKQLLYHSRIDLTQKLVDRLGRQQEAPSVMISGSAVGFYGSQGDEILKEESRPQEEFTHELCRDWEAAALNIEALGTRLCRIRTAVVLDKDQGALPQMLLPFRLFVGGKIGSGKQYMSWIHLQDEVSAIDFLIHNPDCRGAYNLSSPNAVTNREFSKTVGKVLHRPSLLPLPAFVVKILFGEMGEKLLLSGQRVYPARLLDAGFNFQYATLEGALKSLF